jgi:hypothetical protein
MKKLETSAEDSFWQERMIRHINECTSIEELREIGTLLAKIATTRQTAVKWLVEENMDLMEQSLTNWVDEAKEIEPDWMAKVERPKPWPGDLETQS